jgi:hypothetical protein
LFFLTDIDVPWEKDDLRDKAEGRESVFAVFKQTLIDNNKPFIILSGDKSLRLSKAIAVVEDLAKAQKMGFSSLDFTQIYRHEIPLKNIQNQLNLFKNGIGKAFLTEPGTTLNGITKLSEVDFQEKVIFFDAHKSELKFKNFVPASGAATRMFMFLSAFLNEFDLKNESINAYINRKKDTELSLFIVGMDKFPFFKEVYAKLKEVFPEFDLMERDHKNYNFIKILLSPDYFDFANKPKGILPFHKYKTHIATAIEEHLYECAHYSNSNGKSHLHFTVSEIHQNQFEKVVNVVKNKVELELDTTIDISYSYQYKSTDTIAVDLNNNPFRDEKAELVFRPGGHGALIENLNNLDSDIVFIKNIDNVIKNQMESIVFYKKALAGILIELQQQIFQFLNEIEIVPEDNLVEIETFAKNKLNIELPLDFSKYTFENKKSYLESVLDRPIRVCGMVKNEGEPGGGPFWVRDSKGSISLQIVETSQVDLTNANQVKILANATHFNPVDLVCGLRNHKNERFDLNRFIATNSGFIVEKNKNGKPLKGYELPGLWNGGMAKWISVFVEVPLITFNPVKTVNDLLKPAHQKN